MRRVHPSSETGSGSRGALRASFAILVAAMCASAGCALRYVDAAGVEHLWGVGHLTARVSGTDGARAVARGTSTAGLAVGAVQDERYVAVGIMRSERIDVVDRDAAVCLRRPELRAFGIHLGSAWSADGGTDQCL